MNNISDAIFLRKFFPEDNLKITGIDQQENQICIHAKFITRVCEANSVNTDLL